MPGGREETDGASHPRLQHTGAQKQHGTPTPLPKAAWVIPKALASESRAHGLPDPSLPRPLQLPLRTAWLTAHACPRTPLLREPQKGCSGPFNQGRCVTFLKRQTATPPSPTSNPCRPSALNAKTSAQDLQWLETKPLRAAQFLPALPTASSSLLTATRRCHTEKRPSPRQHVHALGAHNTLVAHPPPLWKQRNSQLLPPARAGAFLRHHCPDPLSLTGPC